MTRILTVRFDVTGLSAEEVDALAFEASVQAEADERHPDARALGHEISPTFDVDPAVTCPGPALALPGYRCRHGFAVPHPIEVDDSACKVDHEEEDCDECGTEALDAEAEYGRDTERDYDPDEDRTP